MSIDLSSMTPKALQKLITEASREHKRKKKRAPIAQVRTKLSRLAKAEGYSLAELFGGAPSQPAAAKVPAGKRKSSKPASTGRKVPPKYHNPENPEQTWTGRGKAPLWFVALTDAGKTREQLLIPSA